MKRYITLIATILAVHACTATTASADSSIVLRPLDVTSISTTAPKGFFHMLEAWAKEKTLLEQQAAEYEARKAAEAARHRELVKNQIAIEQRLKDLEKQVGVTWYVFSGSTPSGWDCSGLTRWFYEGLGIEIPHSANKQSKEGIKVLSPKPGDIVLFDYQNNAKMYDHAGIYLGDGQMIHSGGKEGDRTEIKDIESYGLDSKIVYIRLLHTPN